ncbi:hypothetical protein GW17_00018896 [Ensete ventricosum]|nr:hypothetical protein GW17_00018896 [Ensete ventricosum]
MGHVLARKLSSNSLASWLKDKIKAGLSREYHIRIRPRRVVENAQHIKASEGDDRLHHPCESLNLVGEAVKRLEQDSCLPEIHFERRELRVIK